MLSSYILELDKDFTKPFILAILAILTEKCIEHFPLKMFPILGEFTFSIKED